MAAMAAMAAPATSSAEYLLGEIKRHKLGVALLLMLLALLAGAATNPLENGVFGTYGFTRDGGGQPAWTDLFNGYEGVYAVAVSGDGSTAASGGWFSQSPDL